MPADLRVTGPCDFGRLKSERSLLCRTLRMEMLFSSTCNSRSEVQISLEM